jgi:hypothetical protein
MPLKSLIAAVATVLAALAGQGACAAAASSSPDQVQEVTVTAHRLELEHRIANFVAHIAAAENEEGLPRWQKPICPFVTGLPPQQADFVLGRLWEIAGAAGVPRAGVNCHPNLYIWITRTPKELLQGWEQQSFQLTFGADALPEVVDEFITTPRAVRVWYSSDLQDRYGQPASCQFNGKRVPCGTDASHLVFNTKYVFDQIFVIVDPALLGPVSPEQFADYVALVGLAKFKPDAGQGDAPTILKLFEGAPQASPAGLTDWDRAFLKSLYSTDQISKQQRGEIARQMMREIAP